ncbi:UDP-Glycosyltransferase/glycogen phosphorylase [Lenzites betulinus]|nr:UDP-Glycosyltransferase/glycogen phosphorylase [Lenzites betulinus]
MSTAQKHVVAFPYQAWGHTRSLVHLIAHLVKLRDIRVTFISTDAFYDRTVTELARGFVAGQEEYAQRVRVVSVGPVEWSHFRQLDEGFIGLWVQLVAGEAIVCKKTGTRFDPLPKPDAIIIECLAVKPIHAVKELVGDSIKIYAWMSGSTSILFHFLGPKRAPGGGSLVEAIEAEVQRTGRPAQDVAADMAYFPKGELITAPGLPPMHDYEYHPQNFGMPKVMAGEVFPFVHDALERCDGILLAAAEPTEREAITEVKRQYAETGRQAYVCGPLVPPQSASASVMEKQQSKDSALIQEFLDSTLETAGEKSLLYITFGSLYWPANPQNLWAFLDVVMELQIPFIMSHSSPIAVIPEEVRDKVKAYGKGVLSPWVPQQTILNHPATGWFVTHGGQNGVTEAICAGVPLIFWPFAHDQPTAAVHVSEVLQVGYELIEVRTGTAGLHTIYRNGRTPKGTIEAVKEEAGDVLMKAYGADGAEKRKRLASLTHAVMHEWEEGGTALRDAQAFLARL